MEKQLTPEQTLFLNEIKTVAAMFEDILTRVDYYTIEVEQRQEFLTSVCSLQAAIARMEGK